MSEGVALLALLAEELISKYGDADFQQELTQARDLYCERRGRVFEDEEHWENFTRGFLEWYVVEREIAASGAAPARLAAQEEDDAARAEGLHALANSQRSLVEIVGLGKGRVEVVDLFGGARFSVAEERSLIGMHRGDVAEVRLIGFQGQVWLGRLFLDHPAGTRAAIATHLTLLQARGVPRGDALDSMALLRARSRNYKHVPPLRIYQSASDLAGTP